MGTVLIVESLTVDLDGPVHYACWSMGGYSPSGGPGEALPPARPPGGSGDPLVLIHGLAGAHLNWMAVGDRLAIRHRVYAPDLRGFGLTPMRLGQRATLESNQALLEGFLEKVAQEPATLIGNSMGGRLALQVAAHRPELVRRLVLVDPAAPNPTMGGVDGLVIVFFAALLAPMAEPYLRRRSRRMGAEKIVRDTLAVCCEDPNRIPPHIFQAHLDLTRRRLREMPWSDRALVQAARSLLKLVFRRKAYYGLLPRVQAPTLIVHGARDRLVPLAAARELVRLRPDWDLEVLDGVGHVPMLETPDRFLLAVNRYLEVSAEQRAG